MSVIDSFSNSVKRQKPKKNQYSKIRQKERCTRSLKKISLPVLFFSEEVLCVQPLAKHFAIIIVITARKKSETKNYCWAKNITGNSREITTVEIECSKSQIFSRKLNFEIWL